MARYKNIEAIFCGFPEAQDFFQETKTLFSGNLINLDTQKVHKSQLRPNELKIKIMGGSQGAKLINKTVPKIFSKISKEFPKYKFLLSHQCGKGNLRETQSLYDAYDSTHEVKLFEFEESMETFYSNADLIISRAGALSVSEICESQNIAIFIPLKNSIDNHQYKNAKFLVDQGSAFMCKEDSLEENLKNLIIKIMKNQETLEDMKARISKLSLTDKNNVIIKEILSNG